MIQRVTADLDHRAEWRLPLGFFAAACLKTPEHLVAWRPIPAESKIGFARGVRLPGKKLFFPYFLAGLDLPLLDRASLFSDDDVSSVCLLNLANPLGPFWVHFH